MRWNPPSGWFVNVSSSRVPGSRRCGWGSCPVLSLSAFARGAAPISPRALRSRRFSLQVTDPEDPLSMCMTRRRLSLSWGSFSRLVSPRRRARSLLLAAAAPSAPWTRRDFGPRGLHGGAGASRPLTRGRDLRPSGASWLGGPLAYGM